MKKISYIVSRIFEMDYSSFFKTIKKVKEKSKKNSLFIFFDMVVCMICYGSGYNDYYCFGMYDLNYEQRKTILTRGKNNTYVAMLNPKEYWHFYDNKNEFNTMYNDYLKRKWLYLKDSSLEEFKKWLDNTKEFIAKPNNDSGGHGIEKISVSDFNNLEEVYSYLIDKELLLLEELVVQHKTLSKIYAGSVNTLRIITILRDEKVYFVTTFLRIGNHGFVDNSCSGGMLTMVDMETGVTLYPACDFELNVFERHPVTNTKIEGIKIPFFKESKDLCETLAKDFTKLKYIAWDVAITENGPVIIEGNPYPGYYYQFPIHCPNKVGALPIFKDILGK